MGYTASFVRASFWVDRSGLERVVEAGDHESAAHYCENVAFYCGLDLELDDDDNISSVGYEFDKLTHALDEYLDELAPVVRKGSFLELAGEGELLRFDFDGTRCIRTITPMRR